MGQLLDITERKQAEAALRESEERYRHLFESSPESITLIGLDGTILDCNEATAEIAGLPRDEIIGRPFLEIGVLPERELPRYLELFARVLDGEAIEPLQLTIVRNHGEIRWVEAFIASLKKDDSVYAFQIITRDTTERKQAEKHLQQRLNELAVIHAVSQAAASQLELDALFDLIAQELFQLFDIQEVYFALHDRQTDLVQFPYYRHGDQRLETSPVLLGQGLSSRIILSRQPLLINQDYERRSAELGVVRFSPVPGSISQVSWLGVPIQTGEQVIGVICMQNLERENAFTEADVRLLTTIAMNVGIAVHNAQLYSAVQQELAERKRVEQEREKMIRELEARNAEMERFTYTVSHDLKAPLITICGFLGFLEKDAASGNLDRMKADMARIVEAANKMQRLLNELLELSRIGRMMNPPQAVPFETIAREAVELVQGRLAARGVRVGIAPDLPTVYGDHARLVEVVQNLVDNACKFMGGQPEPRIEIGQRGTDDRGNPILFVSDNGMGIEPQYHERVFGLFNKLDAQSEGTGVGLALVKRIIEVHGGRIWVESRLGQGATFSFTLPPAPEVGTKRK